MNEGSFTGRGTTTDAAMFAPLVQTSMSRI